ncbi:hypothetical protein IHV25_01030 [Phaeovibrio sulfidiphilus]|uniref:Autotransporter domain-containing protein n=1 Tax=Phaeovibrio sulfidiphilus TaxID=1220600 RepID=A0A8J7CPY5_9PROT|nr:hypothetical protein [Phaeovibrio sulfidiphilus]MBE1236240.1 hypothetical protein [Phaeovibrio sulfidiphilus]
MTPATDGYGDLKDGDSLSVSGGTATQHGRGGNASWTGFANTQQGAGNGLKGVALTLGGSDSDRPGGSAAATLSAGSGEGTLYFASADESGQDTVGFHLGAGAMTGFGGTGGDLTLTVQSRIDAADTSDPDKGYGFSLFAADEKAADGHATEARKTGSSFGTVTVNFLEDVLFTGDYLSGAVSGGAGNAGDGGSGGTGTVTFAKKLTVKGTTEIKGAAGGDANGPGRGGDAMSRAESYAEIEVGSRHAPFGGITQFIVGSGAGGSVSAGATGSGGSGSTVDVTAGKATVHGLLSVKSGAGGTGSDLSADGHGGMAGSTRLTVVGDLRVNNFYYDDGSIVLESGYSRSAAGDGGASGLRGSGGQGGAVTVTVGGVTVVGLRGTVYAGAGGEAVAGSVQGASGGAGGHYTAIFGASNTHLTRTVMDVGGRYTVDARQGGSSGSPFGGAQASGVGGRGGDIEETYQGTAHYKDGLSIKYSYGGTAEKTSTSLARGGDGGDIRMTYLSDMILGDKSSLEIGEFWGLPFNPSASLGAGTGGNGGAVQVKVARDVVGGAGPTGGLGTAFQILAGAGGVVKSTGNAGHAGPVGVHVGRDFEFLANDTANHVVWAGHGGNNDVLSDPRPADIGKSGNGGDVSVSVGRAYRADGAIRYGAGRGGLAGEKVAGARGGKVDLTAGVLDIQKDGVFTAGSAGRPTGGFAGGDGGSVTVSVTGRAAFFGYGAQFAGGDQDVSDTAIPARNGKAGNVTFSADEGFIYSQDRVRIVAGGGRFATSPAGSVSVKAKSLTLTDLRGYNDEMKRPANGLALFGSEPALASVAGLVGGSASLDLSILRTDGGGGAILDIERRGGSVSARVTNLVAVREAITVNLNEDPVVDPKTDPGSFRVGFTNLGMDGGTALSLASANETVAYSWQAGGHLYAANAISGAGVNTANRLDVTRTDKGKVVAVQQSGVGRTAVFDVANLAFVPAEGPVPQILAVNAGSKDAFGLAINDTTKVTLLGADNVRPGQAVNLVNTAAGSTFTGHSGPGTLGDSWGNVADATYDLGIVTAADKKNTLQATVRSFEIRKDWVIDTGRDLKTVAAAETTDWRRLSVPGTLHIVDNRYSGPNSIAITVDDNKGTRGRADLWADRIHVGTTNTVSRDWIENPIQITSTTLDFSGAVAGNLKDRSARGVAFGSLALGSGSQTVLRGDMAGAGGAGNYAFGGHLEVGDMFRDYHTSARLTNTATSSAGAALTVDRARFHLSNDLPDRIAFADAWMAHYDGQRYANDSTGAKNRLVTDRGGNGIVMLEVNGNAPQGITVHFDRDWTVDLSQSLAGIDRMETLRKDYGARGLHAPRLTLVDNINSDLSTIRGQTFEGDRTATVGARSWGYRGFLEGVYAVGYGNNDASDAVRDWGTNDSVILEFRGIAADLGKSALQARTASETLLNQGQDLAADMVDNALPLGTCDPAKGVRGVALVATGGGHRAVDTGSSVSGTGFSLAAGPGVAIDHTQGRTTVGLLFEAGWGGYDLNNAFAWRGAFNGKTDSRYYGGALVARHEFCCSGIYGEASFRAGTVDTEYKGHQSATDFDSSALYVGGHVGVGAVLDTWQDGAVDVYARGLFTRMGSDTATDTAGEELRFDSSLSVRSRLGARLSHAFLPSLKGYVGGAWEYEFDGKQQGTARLTGSANVAHIPAIDIKGHTGIGEVGVQWAALENLSVGAGFQGSMGQRESYGGTARVMYSW